MALTLPFEQAVVVADGALADPLVGPALVAAMERAAGRTGIERARRVVAFADGRSGSAGESRSRVAMMRAGLPMPVLQWDVHSPAGSGSAASTSAGVRCAPSASSTAASSTAGC